MLQSPRLGQYKIKRRLKTIPTLSPDIVIVGGGIAGVTTAYQILTQTNFSVTIIEGKRIGHGATGHNAGQLACYMEKSVLELAHQFGAQKTLEGYADLVSAWDILKDIFSHTNIPVPYWIFPGYAGCQTIQQLISHLNKKLFRESGGVHLEKIYVSIDWSESGLIPKEYNHLFTVVEQGYILEKLGTKNTDYHVLLETQKGCMNSAHFAEELTHWMINTFPDRVEVLEDTKISQIDLYNKSAAVFGQSFGKKTNEFSIDCKKVILCTNGFDYLSIKNYDGPDIDKGFHTNVSGIVGYMAGYLEQQMESPSATSYFMKPGELVSGNDLDVYFYATRRPISHITGYKTLVCVGGPEAGGILPVYHDSHPYPKTVSQKIESFINKTFHHTISQEDFYYKRHGLMGYTSTGVRTIGAEPRNSNLIYNLGCNGVGLLSSLFGSWKIGKLLTGKKFSSSIRDPQ